ncbi:SDR family oxidoreductase [Gryllotalpicola reticulitermitis]|uniref:SDR family oxidoreductase n=1 Tax=Gryllotalpicola reticulitermitis TaxID=1184153 RepID=A0ABV8Q7Y2_9MICO
MTDLFELHGRTALVTGSTRGIGRALAEGLAAAGCGVVIHGRNAAQASAVASELHDRSGIPTTGASFDVADADAVAAGVARIEAELGAIDVLVNNAGIQRRSALADFPVEWWDEVIATNLTGAFLVAQAVARGMVQRGQGKIVNIGSVQSLLGRPGITPYAASKGGVVMLTKGLCADLAPHGIQVNAIAPGYFITDLTESLAADAQFDAWVRQRTPAGRWGSVDELVGALRFLSSDASNFVNGQTIYVDGGMTAVV